MSMYIVVRFGEIAISVRNSIFSVTHYLRMKKQMTRWWNSFLENLRARKRKVLVLICFERFPSGLTWPVRIHFSRLRDLWPRQTIDRVHCCCEHYISGEG